MKVRLDWVDYAKGIGIVLVVYGHAMRGLYDAGLVADEKFFRYSDSYVYSFHMPLFFLLSGLFFFHSVSGKTLGQFLTGKFKHIFYPYIIWSIIHLLIVSSMSGYTNNSASLSHIGNILFKP